MASGWFCRAVNISKLSYLSLSLSLSFGLTSADVLAVPSVEKTSLSLVDVRANLIQDTTPPSSDLSTNQLILRAQLPENLELPAEAIDWRVFDGQGVQVQHIQGQEQSLELLAGYYQVQLKIGQFTVTKPLSLKAGVISTPYFKANIGRLAVEANHVADWSIKSLSQTEINFEFQATQQVDTWVAAGFYEVTPTHSGVTRRQVVNVLAGEISTVNIDIPMVEVSLIAVENNQPLFKPVEWAVFRLEKGERQYLGSYYQHSQGITVPVGYYEVVATHDSTVRSRQFWVKENTSNKIVLAMD